MKPQFMFFPYHEETKFHTHTKGKEITNVYKFVLIF